eukprot:TRINITY_DN25596_c0_g1_i1.p1 TRINITY_DN25596_c0_g1~~TRINITY_DN25596_c0_g1_i1.p1  ORF type:complete len:849 (-),score=212.44 TRINITY_DN25596_c0_g1_i1:468-2927(-)
MSSTKDESKMSPAKAVMQSVGTMDWPLSRDEKRHCLVKAFAVGLDVANSELAEGQRQLEKLRKTHKDAKATGSTDSDASSRERRKAKKAQTGRPLSRDSLAPKHMRCESPTKSVVPPSPGSPLVEEVEFSASCSSELKERLCKQRQKCDAEGEHFEQTGGGRVSGGSSNGPAGSTPGKLSYSPSPWPKIPERRLSDASDERRASGVEPSEEPPCATTPTRPSTSTMKVGTLLMTPPAQAVSAEPGVDANQERLVLALSGKQALQAKPTEGLPAAGEQPYTFEAWVKVAKEKWQALGYWGTYGQKNQMCGVAFGPGGCVKHYWFDNDLDVHEAYQVGEWTHVAATFDGEVRKLYVNGEELASDRPGPHSIPPLADFMLGRDPFPEGDVSFEGEIDEVRIWKEALSSTQLGRKLDAADVPEKLARWYVFDKQDCDNGKEGIRNLVNESAVLTLADEETELQWVSTPDFRSGASQLSVFDLKKPASWNTSLGSGGQEEEQEGSSGESEEDDGEETVEREHELRRLSAKVHRLEVMKEATSMEYQRIAAELDPLRNRSHREGLARSHSPFGAVARLQVQDSAKKSRRKRRNSRGDGVKFVDDPNRRQSGGSTYTTDNEDGESTAARSRATSADETNQPQEEAEQRPPQRNLEELRSKIGDLPEDRGVMLSARESAARGGTLGALSGGAIGAVAGIVPAFFTFGLSIPIFATIGTSAGFYAGATTGGLYGAAKGLMYRPDQEMREKLAGMKVTDIRLMVEKVGTLRGPVTKEICAEADAADNPRKFWTDLFIEMATAEKGALEKLGKSSASSSSPAADGEREAK